MAVRCPFGCRPELGGPWVPAFAGKTMREFSARLGPPRFSDSSALSLRFPRESGGPGAAMVPRSREWISAQWIFRRHDAWVLVKESTLRAVEAVVVQCPFGCRLELGGPWVPAFAGKTRGRKARGPGAAVVPLPREWTSAQWVFRRHDAWVLVKESTLRAAEAVVVRCPFGCRPELGGLWVPAFAGKTRGRKARGPGAAMVPRSRSRPQRSGFSAGTMLGCS